MNNLSRVVAYIYRLLPVRILKHRKQCRILKKKLMHDSELFLITFQILCIYNMSIEIQSSVLSLVFICLFLYQYGKKFLHETKIIEI